MEVIAIFEQLYFQPVKQTAYCHVSHIVARTADQYVWPAADQGEGEGQKSFEKLKTLKLMNFLREILVYFHYFFPLFT